MNNFPGRNDHIHGDEQYLTARPEITPDDILEVIANNGADVCGVTAREWIKQLAATDALFHLLVIVSKDRHNQSSAAMWYTLKTRLIQSKTLTRQAATSTSSQWMNARPLRQSFPVT